MITEDCIRDHVNSIVDPCSRAAGAPAGLIDMGMVPEVCITPQADGGAHVRVKLIVTHPFCMMSNVFVREICERIGALDGVGAVEVDFDAGEIWTPDLMTPDYAARLEQTRERRRAELAERLQPQDG